MFVESDASPLPVVSTQSALTLSVHSNAELQRTFANVLLTFAAQPLNQKLEVREPSFGHY